MVLNVMVFFLMCFSVVIVIVLVQYSAVETLICQVRAQHAWLSVWESDREIETEKKELVLIQVDLSIYIFIFLLLLLLLLCFSHSLIGCNCNG